MPNKKITELNYNTNPSLEDVFPVVNSGQTKQLSFGGFVDFIGGKTNNVTGGTFNTSTGVATFTNSSGGTFEVTGFYTGGTVSGDYLPLTGGTVDGPTVFTNGLSGDGSKLGGLLV